MHPLNLTQAQAGKEYVISAVHTGDAELDSFLFSLGCYSGATITVVTHRQGGCVVAIRDGRYNLDKQLAAAIEL